MVSVFSFNFTVSIFILQLLDFLQFLLIRCLNKKAAFSLISWYVWKRWTGRPPRPNSREPLTSCRLPPTPNPDSLLLCLLLLLLHQLILAPPILLLCSKNWYEEGRQEKGGVLGKETFGISNYGLLCSSVVMKFLLRLLDWCGRCCSFGEGGTAYEDETQNHFPSPIYSCEIPSRKIATNVTPPSCLYTNME